MRITRGALADLVVTEVRRRLTELATADDEDQVDAAGGKSKKSKGKKGATTVSADQEPVRKGPGPDPINADGVPDPSTPNTDQELDPGGPTVDGDQTDPDAEEHDEEDREDSIDADGENGEEPSGAVNNDVSGKTIQAVTVEPQSEILPGAKEVVLTFNETTDPLRLLITPTGNVKFFWRNQLSDLP